MYSMSTTLIGFILAKVFAFFVFLLYEKIKGAILRYERKTITKYSIWYQYKDLGSNGIYK